MMDTPLKILIFNCNSIISAASRRHEFANFLRKYDVDIALLSETFLKPRHVFDIPNFRIVRNDDIHGRGGGTAIVIRNGIRFSQVSVPSCDSFRNVTGVQIYDEMGTCTLFSVYVPNSASQIQRTCLNKLLITDDRVVIGGDFNAKSVNWGCFSSNSRGKSLEKYVNDHPNVILSYPDTPTCYPSDVQRRPSVIDLFLTKNVLLFSAPVSISGLFSDHNPVALSISLDKERIEGSVIDYARLDWDLFRNLLDVRLAQCNVNLMSPHDVELAVQRLEFIILDCLREASPRKRESRDVFPAFIRTMIAEKNRLRRMYQKPRFRTSENKSYLNALQRRIDDEVRIFENARTKRDLEGLRPYDDQMYVHVKRLTKKRVNIPPLRTHTGEFQYADREKAELLARHFASVHSMNDDMGDAMHSDEVNAVVEQFVMGNSGMSECIQTDCEQVTSIMRELVSNKAPGFDGIKNIVLKNLSKRAILLLTRVINAIFRLNHFPDCWKTAKILAFAKPNKPADVTSSYRPISLLPSISKMVERIYALHLRSQMSERNILPDEQFGFREGHSTVHALMRLTRDLSEKSDDGMTSVVVSLDVEKAFDTFWVNSLLFKMIEMCFPAYLIMFAKSYLSNRKFVVCVNDSVSSTYEIENCFPQGSILGPLFYITGTCDVPKLPYTRMTIFADDTSIVASSKYPTVAIARAQVHLNRLSEYYSRWRIRINPAKTTFTIFSRRRNVPEGLALTFDGSPIARTNELKLLGVTFDKRLTFTPHVNNVIAKSRNVMSMLYPLWKHDSGLVVENRVAIYAIFVRPVLTYAIQVWNIMSESNRRRIRTIQNKFLRATLNLRPDPYTFRQVSNVRIGEVTGIVPFDDFVHRLTMNLYERMLGHHNELIQGMTDFDPTRIKRNHQFYAIRERLMS